METSIFVARVAAVIYLSAALGMRLDRDRYRRLVEELADSAMLSYLSGFLAIVIGALIVRFHGAWNADWTVLVTIVGWLALVKGIFLVAFPGVFLRFARSLIEGRSLDFFPYVAGALGLVFAYFGFVR
jgi:hypothetical protein